MINGFIISVIVLLILISFIAGRRRAISVVDGKVNLLKSLPQHYGLYLAIWTGLPAIFLFAMWSILQPVFLETLITTSLPDSQRDIDPQTVELLVSKILNVANNGFVNEYHDPTTKILAERLVSWRELGDAALLSSVITISVILGFWAYTHIKSKFQARNYVEKVIQLFFMGASLVAIFTTFGIVLSLVFETIRFFEKIPVNDFLFGLEWSPQTALRGDQVASEGSFGAVPIFIGTLLVTLIAMAVAAPIGLMSAIYLSEYAPRKLRDILKPGLEILAGVPTVVYGFFAALTVAPFIREVGNYIGIEIASESALSAGLVMGIMIIPFVSSLSDDIINAVPQTLRDGSYALGATQYETIRKVVVPAAFPGIIGGVLLAVSRAIGETMIVVMAAGMAANLTANPLEAVTTVTVQIVTLLVGDQEFDSAKTLSAFALGLTLFMITLVLNVIALHIVRKYREKYD